MKTVTICQADSLRCDDVQPVTIVISGALPTRDGGLDVLHEALVFARDEARTLNEALRASLPGSTYHALLVAMLESKASYLRVPE